MFMNYLKVAVRNLLKQKAHTAINIAGLAVGIACCGIILLYIQNEISYDNYHPEVEQLYRVSIWKDATGQSQGQASVSFETATVLRNEYAEIAEAARIYKPNEAAVVLLGDRQFSEERFFYAEQSLFDLFAIRFLHGSREQALRQPNTIVVSAGTAQKYFGTRDVVGHVLTVNLNNRTIDYKITGVVADAPQNTHFKYELIASFESVLDAAINQTFFRGWFNYPIHTYIRLQNGTDVKGFEAGMLRIVEKYFPATRQESRLFLQPVRDIHLHSHLANEFEGNSDIIYIYIFAAIALLVLAIAGINFMNLSTARSMGRAREVGLRKVLGAARAQLIRQFLAEALLVSMAAVVVALGLIELFLLIFNKISIIDLQLHYGENLTWLAAFILFAVTAGLLAGAYPAFFLSAILPIKTVKGSFTKSTGAGRLRRTLVVLQVAITIVLLIGIATISQQLEFVRNKKLGFEKEQMLLIPLNGTAMRDATTFDSFKDQLLQLAEVKGVTRHSWAMGEPFPIRSIFFNSVNESEKLALPFVFVGHDYGTVYGLEFVEGRDFSRAFATDTNFVYIVNESAVRAYDLQPAVGRMIATGDLNPRRGQIVGVVKDFHFSSLHDKIEPLVIGLFNIPFGYIAVKLQSAALPQTIEQITNVWHRHESQREMAFSFVDDRLEQAYKFEAQLGTVMSYFTALAIFIACLGLFAIAAFAVEQRVKEIGIRKVLGASVGGILFLLSRDFINLVLLANLIAWPAAWLLMKRWLEGFAYRIDIGIGLFLLAGAAVLVIALLTVSTQAVRAALANPVDSLRAE